MKTSLLSKFIIASLVAIVLTSIVASTANYTIRKEVFNENQKYQISSLIERTQLFLPKLIWDFDTERLEKQIHSEISNPFINSLVVADENGDLLFGLIGSGTDAYEELTRLPEDFSSYQSSQLRIDGNAVGTLWILPDQEFVDSILASILMWQIVLSTLYCLIIVGVVIYFLRSLIIVPLEDIGESVSKNLSILTEGFGRSTERLEVSSNDEIGQLAEQFNVFMDQLAERDKSLMQALKDAQSSHMAKSAFLANMSHEIRTPMNGILGMITLATYSDLDADQRDLLETALHSGESLLTILNEILDVSKIDAGKMELESIDVDLPVLVEEVVDLMSESAASKGIELSSFMHSSVPQRVKADPTRLRQVLNNLISNAVKFTSTGHVMVHIECPDRGLLHVEVRDTGIGIKAAAIGLIFENFSQADETTTRIYGGTGLGLTLCRKFVELMGGQIGVNSEYGKGSTFWFDITFEYEQNLRSAFYLDAPIVCNSLVICENAMMNELIEGYFTAWKLPAPQIAKFNLQDVAIDSPHLVLVDVVDELQAIESLREFKKLLQNQPVKFVAMCAHSLRGKRKQLMQAGFNGFLSKPIRLTKLRECLQLRDEVVKSPASKSTVQICQEVTGEPGKQILVVEDNLVNQKVAQGILKKLGYRVQIANNGQEAVDMLKERSYDLVFMDCQMPVLDGLEATRQIRKMEAKSGQEFQPIVAMTAHALEEHREASLLAGMNDHVTKPVSRNDLARILDTWCR